MALTPEQQSVIDTLSRPDVNLVLTPACAGSGKTHTLVELANQLNPKSGIYLAYNKAIAEEAGQKFKDTNIKCLTVHSLAYSAVVRQYGLKVGYFGPRDVITENISYADKKAIVDAVESFLVSPSSDPVDFLCRTYSDNSLVEDALEHLNLMANGEISCNHNFYLKMYQSLIATKAIPAPETDLLLLDEAGDLNPVTLELFRLINAPKKIAVGDSKQNIYGFNGTINGFTEMADEGVTVALTQSFRVAAPIASKIEKFICKHVDPSFIFTGRDYPEGSDVETTAYIARNNTGLVEEMFHLMDQGKGFSTTRKIDQILELPLILANLSNGKPIEGYKYKHLENLRKAWERSKTLQAKGTINSYIRNAMHDDDEIRRGFDAVMKHGPKELNTLTKYVKECSKKTWPLTLTTAHSSKGLEFDAVIIAPDLVYSTDKAIAEIEEITGRKGSESKVIKLEEELLLAYVACSRAKVSLKGATFLEGRVIY